MDNVGRGNMPLRVAFVCQWYYPEPVTQPGWMVEGLRARGAAVTVMTGVPNYPSGRVASGYRAWRPRLDHVDGIRVHRYPLYPSHDARAGRRMLNYLSWSASGTLLGQRMLRQADVALVYSSPATAALPALIARKLSGVPYVLVVQDIWPDSVFTAGFLPNFGARLLRWMLDRMVNTLYASAAKVVVISPGVLDLLESRGVPREKLALVYNWVPEVLAPAQREPKSIRQSLGLELSDFVVMYAGNHGGAQALDNVIEAFGLLPNHSRAHLVLVGDGVEKDQLRVLSKKVAPGRVHFLDAVPRDQVTTLMPQGDVHLVSLADDPLFAVTMPSKIQSILAAGLPALVCASGDAARVVESAGAGLTASPGDPSDLAAVIDRLASMPEEALSQMGASGRQYYDDHMSPLSGSQELMDHLAVAARRSAEPGPRRADLRIG